MDCMSAYSYYKYSDAVVPQVYRIQRISLKTETLHVATFQCVITAMETSSELL